MATTSARLQRAVLGVGALLVLAAAWTYGSRMESSTQITQIKQVPQPNIPVQVPSKPVARPVEAVANPSGDTGPAPAMQGSPATFPGQAPVRATPAAESGPEPTDPDIVLLRARNLTLPVQGVSNSQLTDTYTQARAAGTPHEAIDIMAARGTPVVAVEDGKLAKLFLSKPGGITIYQFDPANEYAYYYAHLDRYADGISEGATVQKGQLLGYVGSSGNASPDAPHLHFAIFKLGPERQWWRGTPLNPYGIWRAEK